MSTANTRDPETVEREVRQTQDEIGDTVEKLDPHQIADSLLGEDGEELARNAMTVVRENPLPVAMIAVGVLWLVATSNAPPLRRLRERFAGRGGIDRSDLRRRSEHPAPIGPPPATGEAYDRRRKRAR
jgi:hypothetical protein